MDILWTWFCVFYVLIFTIVSCHLIALDQIDERVLSELPEDIQAEIREALRKRTSEFVEKEYRTDSRRGSQVEELKPGCSHWTASDVTTDHSGLNALPPYSQVACMLKGVTSTVVTHAHL